MSTPDVLALSPTDHVRGPSAAPLTVVQYGDYDCPHTRRSNRILNEIVAEAPDRLRFVYRHFPLRQLHANAELLAEVAEAATAQGRFWELHDRLMGHLSSPSEAQIEADVTAAGADFTAIVGVLTSAPLRARIESDVADGRALGVHSTPTFFFNGVLHDGHYDRATLLAKMEEAERRAGIERR